MYGGVFPLGVRNALFRISPFYPSFDEVSMLGLLTQLMIAALAIMKGIHSFRKFVKQIWLSCGLAIYVQV